MKRTILSFFILIEILFSINAQKLEKTDLYGTWYLKNNISSTRIDTLNFIREKTNKIYSEWNFKKEGTVSISSEYIPNSKSYGNLNMCNWELKKSNEEYTLFIESKDTINNSVLITIQEYSVILLEENVLKIREGSTTLVGSKKTQPLKYYFTQPNNDLNIFRKDTLILSLKRIEAEYPRIEFYQDSKFCFFYNVQSAIKWESEMWMEIEKSNKLKGSYMKDDILKNITLSYEGNEPINYSILNSDNLIYFIRQK